MLAALGCKLQRLRLHSLEHSSHTLVPAIWKHCQLLSTLEVDDVEFYKDYAVRPCMNASLHWSRAFVDWFPANCWFTVSTTRPVSNRPLYR